MRRISIAILFALSFGSVAIGCDSSSSPTDSGIDSGSVDAGVDSGSTDSGTTDAGGDGGGDAGPNCVSDAGCYSCKPTNGQTSQFLNACTNNTCSKFDNATRIPAATWVPGTPLPQPQ